MHADLFASTIRLWRDLFPDCGDVPDDFDVANWLETESEMGKSCPWSDTLLAFHYGIEVTAFVYMSFFKNEIHGYGTFIGIDPDWRPKTTFSWVAKRIIEEIASSHPQCQGIFFDVNEVDAQGIEEAAKDDFQDAPTEWIQEQSQRLLRINHFINNGARLLVSGGSPARIIQPSLREPLEIANERSHYLMYWPARNGGYPSDIKSLVRTYYNSYLIGFGPDGTSIPGYEMYLDDVQSRTVENISEKIRFEKFFITGAMKKLIRISRSLR